MRSPPSPPAAAARPCCASFAFWALVGTGLSFAVLYPFTPLGMVLLVVLVVASRVMLALEDGSGSRRERLGVWVGPGGVCLIIGAATSDSRHGWLTVGGAIVAVVLVGYVLALRCDRLGGRERALACSR